MAQGLYIAAREARFQHVKYLLGAGLEPCVRNYDGANALVAALQIEDDFKRKHMFNLLLRSGVPPSNRDTKGRDALMWAAILNRHDQFIRVLGDVSCNCDILRPDKRGYTILHYICHNNNLFMLSVLLRVMRRYHLSVDVKDAMGETPYSLCRRIGHNQMAAILVEAGASVQIFDIRLTKCFQKTQFRHGKVKRVKRKYPELPHELAQPMLPAIKLTNKATDEEKYLPKVAKSAGMQTSAQEEAPMKSKFKLARAKTAPDILISSRDHVREMMNLLALQRLDTYRPAAVPPPPPSPEPEEQQPQPSPEPVILQQQQGSRLSLVSTSSSRRRRSSSIASTSSRIRRCSVKPNIK